MLKYISQFNNSTYLSDTKFEKRLSQQIIDNHNNFQKLNITDQQKSLNFLDNFINNINQNYYTILINNCKDSAIVKNKNNLFLINLSGIRFKYFSKIDQVLELTSFNIIFNNWIINVQDELNFLLNNNKKLYNSSNKIKYISINPQRNIKFNLNNIDSSKEYYLKLSYVYLFSDGKFIIDIVLHDIEEI
jgi:hypothetical protein